jgi:hypothetical protein
MGALADLGFLLLAAVASAIWVRGRVSQRRSPRFLAVILLSGLGLLAFAFSAISPNDDLVQTECLRVRKSFRILSGHTKVASAHNSSVNISAIPRLVRKPQLHQPEGIVERLLVVATVRAETFQARLSANRAPPLPI